MIDINEIQIANLRTLLKVEEAKLKALEDFGCTELVSIATKRFMVIQCEAAIVELKSMLDKFKNDYSIDYRM